MKQKIAFGIFVLTLVAVLGVGSVTAFGNGFMKFGSEEENAQMIEEIEAIREAVENSDYDAWKVLMEERINRIQLEISEENFKEMVERHNEMEEVRTLMQEAKESGDWDKVQELKEEYGFGNKMNGRGMHKGEGQFAKGDCFNS